MTLPLDRCDTRARQGCTPRAETARNMAVKSGRHLAPYCLEQSPLDTYGYVRALGLYGVRFRAGITIATLAILSYSQLGAWSPLANQ